MYGIEQWLELTLRMCICSGVGDIRVVQAPLDFVRLANLMLLNDKHWHNIWASDRHHVSQLVPLGGITTTLDYRTTMTLQQLRNILQSQRSDNTQTDASPWYAQSSC